MGYERLVGMQVTDEAGYARYREGMLPILREHGGAFVHDFRVSEVLRSQAEHPINRVFLMRFPDVEACERFFGDPRYAAVRERWFAASVGAYTVLAAYDAGDGATG